MDFKGARGKWEYLYDGCDHCYDIVSDNSSICSTVSLDRISFDTDKEIEANALLISKAPEMLELINEFYLMCIQKTFPTEHELVYMAEKAKKLIKEATEL